MKEEPVLWEKRNHIRIMTYNRPEVLNAMNLEMAKLEDQYLAEFKNDDDAWVLIYTGTGRAFSAGMDLTAFDEMMKAEAEGELRVLILDPPEIWKPIIAAINGYAIGGGLELALACDIRIIADDGQVGLPEVTRAIIPGAGGTSRLPRLISLGDALKILLTGDRIDAQECYRIGLAQKVVPREHLLEEAIKLAEKICENGPVAVRLIKEAVYHGLDVPLHTSRIQSALYAYRNLQLAPEDVEEGVKSFIEKRKPFYKGR